MDEEHVRYVAGVATRVIDSAYGGTLTRDAVERLAEATARSFLLCREDEEARHKAISTVCLLDGISDDGEVDADTRMDALWVLDELCEMGIGTGLFGKVVE